MTSSGASAATSACSSGDRERLEARALAGLDEHAAVGADGERGAQRLLRLGGSDGDDHDLARYALLLQSDRFLDGDLVEGFIDILTLASSIPEPST